MRQNADSLSPVLLLLLLLSHFSRVRLCATPQTAAHQAPLSLGFSRQEHWSGLPLPSPVDFPGGSGGKASVYNVGDLGSSPGLGRSPGEGNGNPLQCSKWKVKVKLLSRVQLLVTPWTAAYQAPPSMGFSKQEYWSGVPLPSPYSVLAN